MFRIYSPFATRHQGSPVLPFDLRIKACRQRFNLSQDQTLTVQSCLNSRLTRKTRNQRDVLTDFISFSYIGRFWPFSLGSPNLGFTSKPTLINRLVFNELDFRLNFAAIN